MEKLLSIVEKYFGISISNYERVRAVYKLEADIGALCLKPSTRKVERIVYMQECMKYLANNSFNNLALLLPSLEGEYYFVYNDQPYVISDWIEGTECNFKNPQEVYAASTLLAKLHKASLGFRPSSAGKPRNLLGIWPKRWEKVLTEMTNLKHQVSTVENKDNFDQHFLEMYSYYVEQSKQALELLNVGMYHKECIIQEERAGFCHRDYTWHNLIWNGDKQLCVLDFDYVGRELFAADLGRFAERALRVNSWSIDIWKRMFANYSEVLELSHNQQVLTLVYLLFPQRFWRHIGRYYTYHECDEKNVKDNLQISLERLQNLEPQRDTFINWLAGELGLKLERRQRVSE